MTVGPPFEVISGSYCNLLGPTCANVAVGDAATGAFEVTAQGVGRTEECDFMQYGCTMAGSAVGFGLTYVLTASTPTLAIDAEIDLVSGGGFAEPALYRSEPTTTYISLSARHTGASLCFLSGSTVRMWDHSAGAFAPGTIVLSGTLRCTDRPGVGGVPIDVPPGNVRIDVGATSSIAIDEAPAEIQALTGDRNNVGRARASMRGTLRALHVG